ncbi:hypothetical protein PoB_007553500 [Plakobranchus ocellatus]|uniref:Uncharacterized protein n=1 Tax=Plakobranchus ocellatus TaxID=259542 RepID=A0AAV4DXW8_9GAST|nr:hypothetical protein PoB_007553500 [Plakobranchus ocellatus]
MATSGESPETADGTGEVVVGWLHVWDVDADQDSQQETHKGEQPRKPDWQPRFCELFCDERSLVFRDAEQEEASDDRDKPTSETIELTDDLCTSSNGSGSTTPTEHQKITTSIILEHLEENEQAASEENRQTGHLEPAPNDSKDGKSYPKVEVRRSNSVPNAPEVPVDHSTRSLKLRRKISLTEKPSHRLLDNPEKKLQKFWPSKVNFSLTTSPRNVGKSLESTTRSDPESETEKPKATASATAAASFKNGRNGLHFRETPEDRGRTKSESPVLDEVSSGNSSPCQEYPPGISSLGTVPPIIISAATVAATCVRLVRIRTRLDGGRDHFDTRWGYKARRRAAARRAAQEKERLEREQREREEKQEESSFVSEDGKYILMCSSKVRGHCENSSNPTYCYANLREKG